jgi:hypothetical protein
VAQVDENIAAGALNALSETERAAVRDVVEGAMDELF